MRAVAIGADRGLLRAIGDGAAVHAVLVGEEGLRAFAVRLHEKLLPVAPAAGGGNIGVIDGRLGIARALNLVNVAVAIFATGGNLSALVHLRVDAVLIRIAGIGVALRAATFCGGVSCARLFTSLWQSTQANMRPWMECLSLLWST